LSEARRTQLDQPAATRPLGIRPAIEALPASKIGEVAAVGFGDPAVVPLWFGESDLPTPSFIGDAAVAALRESGGTKRSATWLFDASGKSVREDDELAGCLAIFHRLKHHVVSFLRRRRAIPGAVERDECPFPVDGR